MVYLDGASRMALKGDLAAMYDASAAVVAARARRVATTSHFVRDRIRPYFILRGHLRHEAIIHPAAAGAEMWNVADLCAAYSWPTNLAGGG